MKRCDRMLSDREPLKKCNKKAIFILKKTGKSFCKDCAQELNAINKRIKRKLLWDVIEGKEE